MFSKGLLAIAVALALLAAPALAAQDVDVEPSVWDLTLGLHASELPKDRFVNLACGTNGGPPSLRLAAWTDYAKCRGDVETGWHEIYFEYDDLDEYVARARGDQYRAALFGDTSVYSRPVIASALFDDDGFMRGLRLVTDPRIDVSKREQAYTLGGFLQARYTGDWACEDEAPLAGETEYQNRFVKQHCVLAEDEAGITRTLDTRFFRRAGQSTLDANNQPTVGYFESTARFEEFLTRGPADREQRLASLALQPADPIDETVARAQNCPGCDLSGAILRRANLKGANLAGANLTGASLHAADLSGANLEGADLTNANLNLVKLTGAKLMGAKLSGAMLYGARLDGADLSGVTADVAFAGHASMIRVNLTKASFSNSDLTAVVMTHAVAPGLSITQSRLWDANLSQADLAGAILRYSDLARLLARGAGFGSVDFTGSNLSNANLQNADLSDANFTGAVLEDAHLPGANISGATFEGALLPPGIKPTGK